MPQDFERIADIVSQVFGVRMSLVKPNTHFVSELGADSLDRTELFYELEEEFCIKIPDDAASSLHTIDETLRLVEEIQSR